MSQILFNTPPLGPQGYLPDNLPDNSLDKFSGNLSDKLWPWPHFTRHEMACRHCAELYYWPNFMDRLEQVRRIVGRPLHVLSAHRCALHNARVGGAPLSQHLKLAVDIALYNHDRIELEQACRRAGFTGFGYYQTFLHIDLGRPRQWHSSDRARQLWQTN